MLGAIAGDVIGSIYERSAIKTMDFDLFTERSTFTDDTILTVAVADHLLYGKDLNLALRQYALKYPYAGFGGSFRVWMNNANAGPYNSWGNGSAMRVSPIGFAFDTMEEVLDEAEKSAILTHNHPEGVKGAQAVAAAVLIARTGGSKADIKDYISATFGYNLENSLENIRPDYTFDVSCQGSVPESIIAFLESKDVEDAIRKAISLGGDADTMACIAGVIAQAFYKTIPSDIVIQTRDRLPQSYLDILDAFNKRFEVLW